MTESWVYRKPLTVFEMQRDLDSLDMNFFEESRFMDIRIIIVLLANLLFILLGNCMVYAEDVALTLSVNKNVSRGNLATVSIYATSLGGNKSISAASFTVEYDFTVLDFVKATSSFFETFSAQGVEPTNVIVNNQNYVQPLIANSEKIGQVIIAAASADEKLITVNERCLCTLQFRVRDNASIGMTSVKLHKTFINNFNAGYLSTGEHIPVIVGLLNSRDYRQYDAQLGFYTFRVSNVDDIDSDGLSDREEAIYGTDKSMVDSDRDGLSDINEVSIHNTNPVDPDTDGDGALDGYEVKSESRATDATDTPNPALEFGEIKITHEWKTITYADGATYMNPVVVAKPVSSNEQDPVIVQMRNVTKSSFQIRLKETMTMTGAGGTHGEETIGYIVTEAGSFKLNGKLMVAGVFPARQLLANTIQPFRFKGFLPETAPVILAAVTTTNEEDVPVNVRIGSVTKNGFSYLIQEEEARDQVHGEEKISFIAMEPSVINIDGFVLEVGRSTNSVSDHQYLLNFIEKKEGIPTFIADLQTITDNDPATLRYKSISTSGATVYISEDNSADEETTHALETLGFIAIGLD